MMMRKILLAGFVSLSLVGCRLPSLFATSPGASFGAAANGAGPQAREVLPLTLSGRALFPRRVQATIEDDVAVAATVSLINTGSSRTEATGVTDEQGNFTLTLPKNYQPDPATTYYLEALKGLADNQPGHAAARVRTIVKYSNGWVSLTNLTPGQGISLTALTTAVAIGAALRKGTASPVDFDALLGKVAGATYTPVTNLSLSDVSALSTTVTAKLADNQDPVGAITLNTGTNAFEPTTLAAPEVSTSSAAVAQVGDTLTLTGAGFSSTPANNVVKVNGTPLTVLSSTLTTLTVQVPAGATSGQITVQVGSLIILGPVLSVSVVVSSFTPASAGPGTSVTLHGSGFDPSSLASNVVLFSGNATASVTAATATSLTVTVPTGAVSGPVQLSVLGSQSTSQVPFTVPVTVSSFSPAGGMAGESVTLSGTGFSNTIASNSVTVNGTAVTVTQASATSLRFTVPSGATTGTIAVTVAGQTGTSGGSFVVGQPIPANATIQTFAGTSVLPAGRLATNWAYQGDIYDGIARDAAGNTYFSSVAGQRIYKVDTSGVISVFAGTGVVGFSGDGGQASDAKLSLPTNLAIGPDDSLYVSDYGNKRIRKIDPSGVISTVAGNGASGAPTAGQTAISQPMSGVPKGLALDASGNLYFADSSNNRVYKVNTSGVISVVAGGGASLGDNGPATSAKLDQPSDVAVDASGNLYIADTAQNRIRKVSAGTITTFAGTGTGGYLDGASASAQLWLPRYITLDAAGDLYVSDVSNDRVRKVSGGTVSTVAGGGSSLADGVAATLAKLSNPADLVVDGSGNLYVANADNHRIRKVSSGTITTFAGTGYTNYSGDGGAANAAQVNDASDVAMDAAGDLYIADGASFRIRKVDHATGQISTVAGIGTYGTPVDGTAATAANIASPQGLHVDAAGHLYIAQSQWISMVPKTGGTYFGKAMTAGCIYAIAGGGASNDDGVAATLAYLDDVVHLDLDGSGNLYFVDRAMNMGQGMRIRKVSPSGVISTVAGIYDSYGGFSGDGGPATAAELAYPSGVLVNMGGDVYIADTDNQRIRKVDHATGVISTVAGTGAYGSSGDGGPATSAQLSSPYDLAMDAAGNLYVAEMGGSRIRRISPAGVISTVAGTGTPGFSGDNGAATSAQLNAPCGIALGSFGTVLYIADTYNHRIRKVQ